MTSLGAWCPPVATESWHCHSPGDPEGAGRGTYHEGVIGELVPVQQVLQEVGAFVARVPPGHCRADGAHLEHRSWG